MELETKHFGSITVSEDKIIDFVHGIPGFPDSKKFIILTENNEENSVYCYLQSLDDGDVSLVVLDIFKIMPNYDPLVNEPELEELGEFTMEELLVYSVAVVPEKIENMTVNLKAPIIINQKNKTGKQVIVNNDEYSIRHNVMDIINSEG